jgi:hypothetical protein
VVAACGYTPRRVRATADGRLPDSRWCGSGALGASYGLTAPVDPPSGSVENEIVGVDEHQIAGVQLNRPPAGRCDMTAAEINGFARQFTEILHDQPRTLSVGARIDAHAHVHR